MERYSVSSLIEQDESQLILEVLYRQFKKVSSTMQ